MKKFVILLCLFFSITSIAQINYTVTSLNDDGSLGTLRHAILNTDIGGEIVFDASVNGGTIILTADLPNITQNLTIVGNGISNLTISGAAQYSMFRVSGGAKLTISGMTFSYNKNGNGSIFSADNSNSSITADSILVTENFNSYAFYTKDPSTITITNSTFTTNRGTLFGSDHGSTPNITSDVETDYSNRITVTGSTFSFNTGTIFNTGRFVKIDDCIFNSNTSQIGAFGGLNRYQVLNSTFSNNTGSTLFSFSSALSDSGWGLQTFGEKHHLFNGNTFTGNTGTVINTGSVNDQSKTTITNNSFAGNGTNWTGSPAVEFNNTMFTVIIGPNGALGTESNISMPENQTHVFGFSSNAAMVTWSLGNVNDEALFSIDSSGNLSFNSAPDFETPLSSQNSNIYVVEVIATDTSNTISNQTLTISLTDVSPAVLSAFSSISKTYFDGSYSIEPPTSSNSNTITYTSSNPLVAMVSGTTVTLTGIGSTTITASQTFDSVYDSNSISYTLTVTGLSVITKNGKVSETDLDYVDNNGRIGGRNSLTSYGRLVLVKTGDGLTPSTASISAKQIKTDYASSQNGMYWIKNPNINSGTPFQIYADMTTDGGGWMLLNVGAGTTAAPESNTLTSPDILGYLPRTIVIELAKLSTDVQLRSGNSSTSYAHKTTSTSPLAIGALQSTATDINGAATWANGASSTFVVNSGSWLWNYCCLGIAVGWPKMYHSSNYDEGVHWFADLGMGRKYSTPRDAWFSTWIR